MKIFLFEYVFRRIYMAQLTCFLFFFFLMKINIEIEAEGVKVLNEILDSSTQIKFRG